MVKTAGEKGERLIGVHCSISGGLFRAAEKGGELGCSAIQIFTKSSNQWKAKELTPEDIDKFKNSLRENQIRMVIAHTGYLINLASIDPVIHKSSLDSMRVELERAEALGIPFVVVHMGSHKEAGELIGIVQIVENLKILMKETEGFKTQIVLETSAGQGSGVGHDFNHFSEVLNRLGWPGNIGICIDTAHIFQAGYDISTKAGYEDVMNQFDEIVGLDYVRVFHLNDSKTKFGSRVDRHQHIGEGEIGKDAFRFLLNDNRFKNVPMILETPKGPSLKEDMENLGLIRGMVK